MPRGNVRGVERTLLLYKLARGAWRPESTAWKGEASFRQMLRVDPAVLPPRGFDRAQHRRRRDQHLPMSRIELHAFWPFPCGVDADADLFVQRKLGGRRMVSSREAPACGNKRRKQKASCTPEILNQRHGRASQRRSAACNSRRQASLNSRKGSIPPNSSGKSANDLFGDR